jgi:hypothetical protein
MKSLTQEPPSWRAEGLLNNFRVNKSRKVIQAGCLTFMAEIRNSYKIVRKEKQNL